MTASQPLREHGRPHRHNGRVIGKLGSELPALFGRVGSSGIDACTQPAFAKLTEAFGETAECPGREKSENE
jgi:hypothetical protein